MAGLLRKHVGAKGGDMLKPFSLPISSMISSDFLHTIQSDFKHNVGPAFER